MPTLDDDDYVLSEGTQIAWREKLETGRFYEVAVTCNACSWGDMCLVSEDVRGQEKCLSCHSTFVTTTVY